MRSVTGARIVVLRTPVFVLPIGAITQPRGRGTGSATLAAQR